jgi:hypothetical protein
MKVVRVCRAMTPPQKDLIARHDFGDIIQMKCSKLIPELCLFLMDNFDLVNCVLDFGDRGRIPVTTESVVKVMGVPMGNTAVPYKQDVDATSLMLQMMGITDGVQPTIATLEKELGPEYPEDDAYLRKFVIYITHSLFAPITAVRVSPKCYPRVLNTEAIRSYNWARFIFDMMIHTANAKDTKIWFKACMPYLMVNFLDLFSYFYPLHGEQHIFYLVTSFFTLSFLQ